MDTEPGKERNLSGSGHFLRFSPTSTSNCRDCIRQLWSSLDPVFSDCASWNAGYLWLLFELPSRGGNGL